MPNTTLAARLAATAAGTWGEEAAVWLLDQHRHWLPELQRCGLIREQPTAGGGTATVIHGIVGMTNGLIGTPSEWQVLDLAMALYRSNTTPLFNLTSLDEGNRRLVLHAVAWTAGGRDWAESLRLVPQPTFECEVCTKVIAAYPCALCEHEPLEN